MINKIIYIFAMRLFAIDGINRQSITSGYPSGCNKSQLKNTRYAVKRSRVSFFNLIILNLIPLAESDNCAACKREVSFATYLTVWGLNEKSIRVLRHKKQSKNREWMKTLSPRSLDGNSYDGLAEGSMKCVILETVNTFILSGLQTYFRICRWGLRELTNN